MKILLLSAYDAVSHRHWREGLVRELPEFEWTVLALPARYFSWRLRGNSLSWALGEPAIRDHYDLIVTTSMTDLSALRGLVPSLASTPALVYFHENQFDYPLSEHQRNSVEPQILNLYTALAGDRLLFNSHYNRNSFLEGCRDLLAKLPDFVPPNLIEQLEARSGVLPVPVETEPDRIDQSLCLECEKRWQSEGNFQPIRITWVSRWEYDKGPDRLLAILRELEKRAINYQIVILGEGFRAKPEPFEVIQRELAHRVVQFGYVESRAEYLAWLSTADVVLSTALHEFQGLAVLEAIGLGCLPLFPNREAYPELVPKEYLYDSYLDDIQREAEAAVDRLEWVLGARPAVPNVGRYRWDALKERYRPELLETAEIDRQ